MTARKPRVCFVAQNAYPLLANSSEPWIGGAEVQQSIIAKELLQNDCEVSFVTAVYDDKRNDEIIDGIEIFKTFSVDDGIPLARFVYPRLTHLWRALKRADADVYYQRCADKVTGTVAQFCRRHDRSFIFSGAHENDFQRDVDLKIHERLMYQWGVRRADAIIVQSRRQQELLRENYGIDGHVQSNVFPTRQLTNAKFDVLWVGNMRHFKRPQMCLEIARLNPGLQFVMIGGIASGDPDLYAEVQSHQLPNVQFLGFQPLEICEQYFDQASLFLNTSTTEGFPNTFLQAWSRGIPTLSTFDPDNLISGNDLGKTFSQASEVSHHLHAMRSIESHDRKRIQQFFNENFTPQRYVDGLWKIIDFNRKAPRQKVAGSTKTRTISSRSSNSLWGREQKSMPFSNGSTNQINGFSKGTLDD